MSFCSAQRDLVTVSILVSAIFSGEMGAQSHYIAASAGPGGFPLAVSAKPATILVSASDYPGVVRAAKDFKTDLGKVTGHEPSVAIDTIPQARALIIAGTLGKSALIDRLVREKKLDTRDLAGRWE